MKDFIKALPKLVYEVLILVVFSILLLLSAVSLAAVIRYFIDKPDYSNIPSAANVETTKIGKINMPAVGNNEIYQITLEDGTVCVVLLGGYRGGISCNWEAEEIGCSTEETEEMEYGEPEEGHNMFPVLENNEKFPNLDGCIKQENGSFYCYKSDFLWPIIHRYDCCWNPEKDEITSRKVQ